MTESGGPDGSPNGRITKNSFLYQNRDYKQILDITSGNEQNS